MLRCCAEEPKQRAQVDAALDWSHGTIRAGEAKLVFHRVLRARRGAAGSTDKVLASAAEATLKQALQVQLLPGAWTCIVPEHRNLGSRGCIAEHWCGAGYG